MSSSALLTQWSRLLVHTLVGAGVRHAVISPGSRSTPLTLAALRHGELCCHGVVDERSAAYFALAQGKLLGVPSLLICTSGTAVAHYLPAVFEAAAAHAPLLILSADRPFQLQDGGAPQTTDQLRALGPQVRAFFELGMPDPSEAALRGLRRRIQRAVLSTRYPAPGPVHINFRARKPLEPWTGDPEDEVAQRVDLLLDEQRTQTAIPARVPSHTALERIAADLRVAKRPLVLCGAELPYRAVPAAALDRLAAVGNLAAYCEMASQCRTESVSEPYHQLDLAFRVPRVRRELRPDCIVQFGAAPLAPGFAALIEEEPQLQRHVLASEPWPDPWGTASSLTLGDLNLGAQALAAALSPGPRPGRHAWLAALRTVCRLVEAGLRSPTTATALSARHVCQELARTLPSDWVLAIGNSLPIRELDAYAGSLRQGVRVLTQRGTNGIEGLVSGAAGVASMGQPTVLLLGDVSFLHDIGGLWCARVVPAPFVIIVLNNGGGRIFEQLPVGQHGQVEAEELRFWTTPHSFTLAHAAHLYGVRHELVASPAEFDDRLPRLLRAPGCAVLEVRLDAANEQTLAGAAAHLERALTRSPGSLGPP